MLDEMNIIGSVRLEIKDNRWIVGALRSYDEWTAACN